MDRQVALTIVFPLLVINARFTAAALNLSDIEGWTFHDGRLYRVHETPLEFDPAQLVCESEAGYLATAENAERNAFIRSLASGTIYFGLAEKRETENEGQIYFVSGTNVTWTNWDSGQPDNWNNEDCISMSSNGKWNDVPCSGYAYPFICQKDGSDVINPCDSGFIYNSGRCHIKLSGAATFWAAVEACENVGAPLMCLQSQKHKEAMVKDYGDGFWLGMTDRPGNNYQYTCIDGTNTPYTDWKAGQPNCSSASAKNHNARQQSDGMVCQEDTDANQLICSRDSCVSGWHPHDEDCYQPQPDAKSVTEARSTCAGLGAVLATPHSAGSNTFLNDLSKNQPLWLGLRQVSFAWLRDDDLAWMYNNWTSTPPSNLQCAQIAADGSWGGVDCAQQTKFVCQKVNTIPDYTAKTGYKYVSHYISSALITTIGKCAHHCESSHDASKTRNCFAFDYNSQTQSCQLIGKTFIEVNLEQDRVRDPAVNHYDYSLRGWIPHGNFLYKVFKTSTKYEDARMACEAQGAFLANAHTQQQNEWIRSMISGNTFFGLAENPDVEGKFYFLSGVPLNWTNWDSGQPDNWNNAEDCLYMKTSGLWNDVGCYYKMPYICQKDASHLRNQCSADYVLIGNQCYRYTAKTSAFWDSVEDCEKDTAPLMCYQHQQEREALLEIFGDAFWIGMSDRMDTGITYKCLDGTVAPYNPWLSGQPQCSGYGDHYVNELDGGLKCAYYWYYNRPHICRKPSCLPGWQQYNTDCYLSVMEPKSYDGALQECRTKDAVMATGVDDETNTFISGMNRGMKTWLGGTCSGNGSVIRDDGLPYTYTNWHVKPTVDQACGQVLSDKWIGASCTDTAAYVCKQVYSVPDYKLFKGYRYNAFEIKRLTDFTLVDCLAECGKQKDPLTGRLCYSFDYNNSTKECSLNKNDVNIQYETQRVLDEAWNHYNYKESVCDLTPDMRIRPPYHSNSQLSSGCLTLGYCLAGSTCYLPQNHLQEYDPTPPECPSGWLRWNNKCYNQFEAQPQVRAFHLCRKLGAYLPSIESEEHNQFMYQHYSKGVESFWLAMRDTTGSWDWFDGSEGTYRKWDDGEPSSWWEDGVEMRSTAWWNDVSLGDDRKVVCAKPACPEGWTWHDENCYKLNKVAVIFSNAVAVCQNNEGIVAVPQTDTENTFLNTLADGQMVWMGFQDSNNDGHWSRTDQWSGNYSKWDTAPGGSNLAVMGVSGTWTTDSASGQHSYICQKTNRVAGFRSIPGGYVRAHNLMSYTNISLYECANYCVAYQNQVYEARCISFDYDNHQKICYLSDRNMETVLHEVDWDWHPHFTYYERAFSSGVIDDTGCAAKFNKSGVEKTGCGYHSGSSDIWQWCSKTENYETDWQWKLCEDDGACSISQDRLTTCPGAGNNMETCLYVGCCYIPNGDGNKHDCFLSKSSMDKLFCNDGCQSTYNVVAGKNSTEIAEKYYSSAYDDVKRMMGAEPSVSFWVWMDSYKECREAILSVTYPVDAEIMDGFYRLWEHVGADKSVKYCHIMLAIVFNRRDIGASTKPRFHNTPGYWHFWNSASTYILDTDSRLASEHLTDEQKALLDESENAQVLGAQQAEMRRRRSVEEPAPRDCKALRGDMSYAGKVNITKDGYPCQKWTEHTPNDHTTNAKTMNASYYPDATLDDASNYCRNPDDSWDIWCYVANTTSPRWQYCNVPDCSDTSVACEYPFVSPYTGNTWHRCAYELNQYTPFCYNSFKEKVYCHHDFTHENFQDSNCVFPFTIEGSETQYNSCIGTDYPYCSLYDKPLPSDGKGDAAKYCMHDYGLGNNMYTWESVMDNHVTKRDFKAVKDFYMSKCGFSTVDEIPFPPRDDGPNLAEVMDFYISKMEGDVTGKFFKMFPTSKAEWPILMHLNLDIPLSECEWIWQKWLTNERPLMYSWYSWKIMTEPSVYCLPSKWSPFSLIAINEVGGVCGQHATLEKYTGICLGKPGNLVTQPGHLAMFTIYWDPLGADGPWVFRGHQYVGDSEYDSESSAWTPSDMHSLTLAGQPIRRKVSMDFEKGIVYTMNQGYDIFLKGRIALNIFNRVNSQEKEIMLPYLVDILEEAPYNIHIWYEIADFLTGKQWTIYKDDFRYPKFCKTFDGLEDLRSRLKVLADVHFFEKRHMLHAYYDAITRIIYPASCCKTNPEFKDKLTMIFTKMDTWKEKYADWIRMHYIKCEAVEGSLDASATQMLHKILSDAGNSTLTAEKDRYLHFFNEAMDMFLKKDNPDVDSVIAFINATDEVIPHVEVGEKTWALSIQYDATSKKYIELLNQKGRESDATDEQTYKDHLVDKTNGPDMSFWNELAAKNRLMGSFQSILDGAKVWNATVAEFQTT